MPPPADDRTVPGAPPPPARASSAFEVGPHRRRQSLGWLWAWRIGLGLLLFAGLRVAVIAPVVGVFHHPAPPPPAAVGLDPATASSVAVDYAADYWSYSASDPGARQNALARWSGLTDTSSTPKITGTGQLRADIVHAGRMARTDAHTVIVETTARVTPASLADGKSQPATSAPGDAVDPTPHAADPGPASGAWQAGQPVWLTLDVVVTDTNGLHVTGAALAGDAPASLPAPTSEVDSTLSASTAPLPRQMFDAYGSGQLGYLTVPHTRLTGLSGAVKLADVSGWSVATDPAGTGHRYATAQVTWQLPGSQVQFQQLYALTMTDVEGRWLLAAVGPRIEQE